jgi:hypothetical protein
MSNKSTILIIILTLFMFSGCGMMEAVYDGANYESLTNEKGTVEIISGGKILYSYENAEIKYSSSDTDAIWFVTKEGHEKYAQPGVLIHLED